MQLMFYMPFGTLLLSPSQDSQLWLMITGQQVIQVHLNVQVCMLYFKSFCSKICCDKATNWGSGAVFVIVETFKFSSMLDVQSVKVCLCNFEDNGIGPPKPNI